VETSVVKKADWLVAVEGKVSSQEVAKEKEKLLRRYVGRVKLPGFRPGKAPLSIVAAKYDDEVKAELVEEFASQAYRQALDGKEFKPLSQGRITHWNYLENDELRFEVEAEVLPEFELRGYKSLKLEPVPAPAQEELIEKHLEGLRERMARFEPVEKPAQEGDYLSCDYSIYRNGKKQEKQTGVLIKIGDKENFSEINKALLGKKAQEIVETVVKYPESAGDMAGKEATFKFFIKEVKVRKLPELNDEFAKEMGHKDMATMREKLAEEAKVESEWMVKDKREDQIFAQLLELHPFSPPPSMVQERMRYLISRFRIPDTEQSRQELEPKATEHVKLDLILEAIADAEDIKISDEELDAWFEDRAKRMRIPAIQVKAIWKKEVALDEARRRKTIDYLLERAAGGGLVVHPDSN